MNQKGFINIALVALVAVFVGVIGYFAFVRQPAVPPTEQELTTLLPAQQAVPPPTNNLPASTTQSGIKLVSPNGGERWPLGSLQTIKWNGVPEHSQKVFALLEKKEGEKFTVLGKVSPWAPGSIVWEVGRLIPYPQPERCPDGGCVLPDTPIPGEYFIRVIDPDTGTEDRSNNSFSIISENLKPSVQILYPNGGEVIKRGSKQVVRWSSANIPEGTKFRLMLVYPIKDDPYGRHEVVKLGEALKNTGSFEWVVSTALPAQGNYKISIQNSGNITAPYDEGDGTFSITE